LQRSSLNIPRGGARRRSRGLPTNSRYEDHTGTGEVYECLEMPRWRDWFFDQAGIAVEQPLTPRALSELRRVRAILRDLLEERARPDRDALAWINAHLAASPVTWQLRRVGGDVRLEMTRPGDWSALIATVLTSYGHLLETGRLDRVRRCANPHCTWLFYDESRNASRRWCDPHVCGNLHGVRAHRERARQQSDARGPQ
jgi:predicted RNA-binding Zn ribbon-like protein